MVCTTTVSNPTAALPTAAHPTTAPEAAGLAKGGLVTALEAAFEHARRLTEMYGTEKIETVLAWETVEELQSAQARQKVTTKSAFELYCEANPDAPECRIYDV